MPKRNSLRIMTSQLPENRDKIAVCLAEFVGTAMLIFFGCMGCVAGINPSFSELSVGISFGMIVMLVIMTFGHVSGAHLNPAVSVAAVLYGTLPALMAPLYIVSQCVGAIAGYGALKLITPEIYFPNGVCVTSINPELSLFQALMVEFLCTTGLILVCCGVWDHRNSDKLDSLPIRFGFTVTALALVGGPYTGCSMNPARTLGPALFNNAWGGHWIYWVGPLSAAVVPTTVYNMLFARPKQEEDLEGVEDLPLRSTRKC